VLFFCINRGKVDVRNFQKELLKFIQVLKTALFCKHVMRQHPRVVFLFSWIVRQKHLCMAPGWLDGIGMGTSVRVYKIKGIVDLEMVVTLFIQMIVCFPEVSNDGGSWKYPLIMLTRFGALLFSTGTMKTFPLCRSIPPKAIDLPHGDPCCIFVYQIWTHQFRQFCLVLQLLLRFSNSILLKPKF